MTEYKYRWIRVALRGFPDMPHVDRVKADHWEPVPADDPMCPEHNDDAHRTLVLYRKPIELANAATAALQKRNANLLGDVLDQWRDSASPGAVTTFVEITANPVRKGDISTRDEILARLEDFYPPENFLYRDRGTSLAECNRLRALIGLPAWTVDSLRRDVTTHWKRYGHEPFSKAPRYYVHGVSPEYARKYRVEWGLPANFFEWLEVFWREVIHTSE
jgi:hypothetical protein